jgi:ATP/ADP translocase
MSRIRDAVFPIYGEEKKKFFLLGSIKFFVVLALVLSRDTKDTLIVTQCGAEAIAFLKVRFLHGMRFLFEISTFLPLNYVNASFTTWFHYPQS